MSPIDHLLIQFELHSVEGIRKSFEEGIDPNMIHDGEPLINALINMYTRSPRFTDCVKVFVEYGLQMDDHYLLAVLLDDVTALHALVMKDVAPIKKEYTFRCTYTPLYKATLLHLCAEYNLINCGRLLVSMGIDINARAGVDEHGFGGHTPIFHCVNQNSNNSLEMMNYLLSQDADLKITVPGLIWGKGYEWETFIPSVNPISYAMMGLLPQMHRKQETIAKTVSLLMKEAYNIDYKPANVPNEYLKSFKK
jgi:hypothetical protein